MKIRKVQKNKGFIALMSAIIISVVLLVITTNLSMTGFYNRFNILDTEMKERSSALADSCIDIALLKLFQNSSYAGNENIGLAENTCFIGPVTTNSPEKIFTVRGIFSNAYTNLKVRVDETTFEVISVEEIPVF